MEFFVGQHVEVCSDDKLYREAWFPAVIQKRLDKRTYCVVYKTISDESAINLLREDLPQRNIRPTPQESSTSGRIIQVGDIVDAFHNEAWWEGIVVYKVTEDEFKIFFPGLGINMIMGISGLRFKQTLPAEKSPQGKKEKISGDNSAQLLLSYTDAMRSLKQLSKGKGVLPKSWVVQDLMETASGILPVANEADLLHVQKLRDWGYNFTVDCLDQRLQKGLETNGFIIADRPPDYYIGLSDVQLKAEILMFDQIINMSADELERRRALEYELVGRECASASKSMEFSAENAARPNKSYTGAMRKMETHIQREDVASDTTFVKELMKTAYRFLPVSNEADYRRVLDLRKWGYEFRVDCLDRRFMDRLKLEKFDISDRPAGTFDKLTGMELKDEIEKSDLVLDMTEEQLDRRRALEYEVMERRGKARGKASEVIRKNTKNASGSNLDDRITQDTLDRHNDEKAEEESKPVLKFDHWQARD